MNGGSDWRTSVDDVAPTVLVIGGFLTSPPFYRPMRTRLLRRGAAGVIVANVWTPDWLLAGALGMGSIVGRAARALGVASRFSSASPLSRGAPVLVVGHSAGGMVARLLTADQPFAGHVSRGAPSIGCLVTLGTPHRVARTREIGRRVSAAAAAFADQTVPGAAHAPGMGYLAVASRAIIGRPDGDGRARLAFRLYQDLMLEPAGGQIEGDGVVPLAAALLDGARQLVLEDVVHGQGSGRPWYGADRGLDLWWSTAVKIWRDALRARLAGGCKSRIDTGGGTKRPPV